MSLKTLLLSAAMCSLLFFSPSSQAGDDDWVRKSFDIAPKKHGAMTFEYPRAWGRKPDYNKFDNVTEFAFGPFGPRSKPLFMVQIQSVLMEQQIATEQLTAATEHEKSLFSGIAFETEIEIKALQGANNSIRYFSISDKEKKWGEFDYVTLAVIASGSLLTKCYFFSSDGAPDFGADAIRMMESLTYTPPPPDPDGETEN